MAAPRKVDARWKRRVRDMRRRLERNPELAVCWLCGQPIDMELPPLHDYAFSLDHVVPIARGGGMHAEARPAHRICNARRSDGRRAKNHHETIIEW